MDDQHSIAQPIQPIYSLKLEITKILEILSVFLPLWLICDGSHSIITRQSFLTFKEISLTIFRLSSPGPLQQPLVLLREPIWRCCFASFLSAQTVNGVIGWNDSSVWATDSDWQVTILIMSEVESCRDVASECVSVIQQGLFICVSMYMFVFICASYCRHCSLCPNYKSVWNCVSINAYVCFCVCVPAKRPFYTTACVTPRLHSALIQQCPTFGSLV